MRTAAEPQAVDNFALRDTFTRYPQGRRPIPHRLSAHRAHRPRFYITLWRAAPHCVRTITAHHEAVSMPSPYCLAFTWRFMYRVICRHTN